MQLDANFPKPLNLPIPERESLYQTIPLNVFDESDKKFLQDTLLEMNQENAELRDRIFNGELVTVEEDEHLKVTREALAVQKTLKP